MNDLEIIDMNTFYNLRLTCIGEQKRGNYKFMVIDLVITGSVEHHEAKFSCASFLASSNIKNLNFVQLRAREPYFISSSRLHQKRLMKPPLQVE